VAVEVGGASEMSAGGFEASVASGAAQAAGGVMQRNPRARVAIG
jgi:hypothetical protein